MTKTLIEIEKTKKELTDLEKRRETLIQIIKADFPNKSQDWDYEYYFSGGKEIDDKIEELYLYLDELCEEG